MADQIKIGLVGIGRAGWGMHCEELARKTDLFRIVAACDPLPERREKMALRYACQTYEHLEGLLADPEVELVDIATRSCDHFAHAALALRAGKMVFLEKPITLTHQEAEQLVTLARGLGGKLFIRHNRRFEPVFQHTREIIASGLLGEVFEIKLRRLSYSRRDDWQVLKEFGGGQLLNWGPHVIDHALRLLESPVASQYSELRQVAAAGDAEDHLKLVLRGENGRLVDLEISGGAALGEPEYLVWGTRGSLRATGNQISLRHWNPDWCPGQRRATPLTPDANTFGSPESIDWVERSFEARPSSGCDLTTIWDELHAAICQGAAFPITLDEALATMAVIIRAKEGTAFA